MRACVTALDSADRLGVAGGSLGVLGHRVVEFSDPQVPSRVQGQGYGAAGHREGSERLGVAGDPLGVLGHRVVQCVGHVNEGVRGDRVRRGGGWASAFGGGGRHCEGVGVAVGQACHRQRAARSCCRLASPGRVGAVGGRGGVGDDGLALSGWGEPDTGGGVTGYGAPDRGCPGRRRIGDRHLPVPGELVDGERGAGRAVARAAAPGAGKVTVAASAAATAGPVAAATPAAAAAAVGAIGTGEDDPAAAAMVGGLPGRDRIRHLHAAPR